MSKINLNDLSLKELLDLNSNLKEILLKRESERVAEEERIKKEKLKSPEFNKLKEKLNTIVADGKKLAKKFKATLDLPLILEIKIEETFEEWLLDHEYHSIEDLYRWVISAKVNAKDMSRTKKSKLQAHINDYFEGNDICAEGLEILAPEVSKKLEEKVEEFSKCVRDIKNLNINPSDVGFD